MRMQSVLRVLCPSHCLTCDQLVEEDQSLCGACWRETSFIHGLSCRACGLPLPGEDTTDDTLCDDCMTIARPWHRGGAALLYKGNGRKLVMSLKHGDRTELARPAAKWMAAVAPPVSPETCVVPVPLHWLRLLKRRYNQSALLAQHISRQLGLAYMPQALHRPKKTPVLDGRSRDDRFAQLDGALSPHPKLGLELRGRPVLLIDDVMTSGATLAAATEACVAAGAVHVDVLALARVAKDV